MQNITYPSTVIDNNGRIQGGERGADFKEPIPD